MKLKLTVLAALLLAGSTANAALQSRQSGAAYYDTVLNITWLANADLAKTNTFGLSGIDANGAMSFATAQTWVQALNTNQYLGVSSWRMPTLTPVNGISFNASASTDGSTDQSFNFTGKQSEMAYNFYSNLHGNPQFLANGFFNFSSTWGLPAGTTPFSNVQWNNTTKSYWSGLETAPGVGDWVFSYATGGQGTLATPTAYGNTGFVWAVAAGDVLNPVPEPETYALMLAGLGLLGAVARRKARAA